MIERTEKDGALTFKVQVVPRASRSEIVGEYNGALRVRVAAAPVNGAANAELERLIARALGVPAKAVVILAGHSSKLKRVSVKGATRASLDQFNCQENL